MLHNLTRNALALAVVLAQQPFHCEQLAHGGSE